MNTIFANENEIKIQDKELIQELISYIKKTQKELYEKNLDLKPLIIYLANNFYKDCDCKYTKEFVTYSMYLSDIFEAAGYKIKQGYPELIVQYAYNNHIINDNDLSNCRIKERFISNYYSYLYSPFKNLTSIEKKFLLAVGEKISYKTMIEKKLFKNQKEIKKIRSDIFDKLGVTTLYQAETKAYFNDLIEPITDKNFCHQY